MTRYQRTKRIAAWKGAALALFIFVGFFIASGLAGQLTGQ